MGIQGSLYQRCSSPTEACVRLVQACAVEGLLAVIPPAAICAVSTNAWATALAEGTFPLFHISDQAAVGLPPVRPVVINEPDDILDDTLGLLRVWRTHQGGRKAVSEYVDTWRQLEVRAATTYPRPLPLPPRTRPTQCRRINRAPSPHTAMLRPFQAASLSAVGSPPRSAARRLGGNYYTVVFRGPTPWIYCGE